MTSDLAVLYPYSIPPFGNGQKCSHAKSKANLDEHCLACSYESRYTDLQLILSFYFTTKRFFKITSYTFFLILCRKVTRLPHVRKSSVQLVGCGRVNGKLI